MNRRHFLSNTFRSLLGLLALGPAALQRSARAASSVASKLSLLLDKSPFVYISPLLANGRESSCHAELWYAWLDDAVVVTVSRERWKARSVLAGRDRARIWVGDHGLWSGLLWNNEDFRSAPSFDARGELVEDEDAELLGTLLARYETKYPAEIAQWRDRMRDGHADGSRVLIRYSPIVPIAPLED